MQARLLPAIRGVYWIVDGFRLYRRNPPLLTTLTLGYLLLVLALGQLQPIGPFLLPLLLPLLTTVIANGCRTVSLGLARSALIFRLREERGALLRLGGLHLIGTLAILAVDLLLQRDGSGAVINSTETGDGAFNSVEQMEMLWHMLRLLLIGLPVLLAFWFAPVLTAWEGVPALKSLFFSLVAVWRNWRAFLAYAMTASLIGVVLPGLLLLVISFVSKPLVEILSVILRLLLLMVFAPVLMTGIYQSFQDVFAPVTNSDAVSDAA